MQQSLERYWPKGVPHTLPVPQTTLYYNLEVSATRYPDKVAISYYGGRLAYRELKQQVDALAGYLQAHCGVKKGERVLLYMQNSPQFVIAYYAVLRADAVVVPINPMNLTEELRHYVNDAGTRIALIGQELLARIAPLLGAGTLARLIAANYGEYADLASDLAQPDFLRLPPLAADKPEIVSWRDALAAACVPAVPMALPDDMCAMPYTSGTTGRPKGCMHTHSTLMANTVPAGVWNKGSAEDVILCVVPFFHITGMVHLMHSTLYLGAELVIMTRWDRELALKLIARHQVTGWTNIPTMVIDLFASPNFKADSLASLRGIGGGGAAMPEAVGKRLQELTGLEFVEGYGLTETSGATHTNHPDRPKRQCLGIPWCNTEALVINPDTLEPLGVGEIGEIVSRGPQVFKGYWNDPKASAQAFIDIGGKTYFRTGDLGRYDEEGYFFFADRLKRMINASGFKVWPAEVEVMMYAHPDIQEVCVIGCNDAHRGETVKAIVVLKAASKGGVGAEDLIEWCKTRMAAYKYPRIVEFVDSLPKSATGKVMWRQLQEQESARTQIRP
ncbi:MAG: long-chain fatty acid--CoA ligase [Burkholderiales bacterium]|nr:long-chain fatty acid--CoA ligase [Burkholderiales bacterium]